MGEIDGELDYVVVVTCHNTKCSPKFGCNVQEGKECSYKSEDDDQFLDSKQPGFFLDYFLLSSSDSNNEPTNSNPLRIISKNIINTK